MLESKLVSNVVLEVAINSNLFAKFNVLDVNYSTNSVKSSIVLYLFILFIT
jgi:hypothetical protein